MKAVVLVGFAIGALMTTPGMAQTSTQPLVKTDTVPVQISQQQVKTLQRTLNDKGFSAGHVDGLWGPDTAAALKRFQAKNELNPTGELDRTTELKLGMIKPGNEVATPMPAPAPAAAPPVTTGTAAPTVAPTTPPPTATLTPVAPVPNPTGSTSARQPKPTSGANSFTSGEAQARLQRQGYQEVRNLALDSQGIWRGVATKNGQTYHVWLDYQGNVGDQ